jgi:hypothetical protein
MDPEVKPIEGVESPVESPVAVPPPPPHKSVFPKSALDRIDTLTKRNKSQQETIATLQVRLAEAERKATLPLPTKSAPTFTPEQAVALAQQQLFEEQFVRDCNTVAAKGKQKYNDFQGVISDLNTVLEDHQLRGLYTAILQFDEPQDLLYAVGKDLDFVQDVVKMNPIKAGRALAEKRFQLEVKTSNEAEPIEPVTPTVSTQTKTKTALSLDDPNLPKEDWYRLRKEQIREKRISRFSRR